MTYRKHKPQKAQKNTEERKLSRQEKITRCFSSSEFSEIEGSCSHYQRQHTLLRSLLPERQE